MDQWGVGQLIHLGKCHVLEFCPFSAVKFHLELLGEVDSYLFLHKENSTFTKYQLGQCWLAFWDALVPNIQHKEFKQLGNGLLKSSEPMFTLCLNVMAGLHRLCFVVS
ncbi:hypothetical protein JRQ81_019965, partial [Phrynocephalus forsythii]